MYETVLFDGTDVKSTGVRILRAWESLLETPPLRGADLTVTDADGETPVDERAFDAYDLNIALQLKGLTGAAFNDAQRALALMCKIGSTVTLTRRKSYAGGNEEHTTLARYVSGLGPQQLYAMVDADLTLVMRILSGVWYGGTVTIAAGTSTILGTARTRRMTITFTGGTNPSLTNSTTGDSVTWTGTVGGTPVVISNETITALQGATNVSGGLSHSRTYPMTLQPGSNTLVLTGGGSVSIAYAPVHLV
jgi:hypothetical protein